MPSKGRLTTIDNQMTDIMKHDYLRQSIENRVQRRVIQEEFEYGQKQAK